MARIPHIMGHRDHSPISKRLSRIRDTAARFFDEDLPPALGPQNNQRRYRPVSERQAALRSSVPMNSSSASGMNPSCSSSSRIS